MKIIKLQYKNIPIYRLVNENPITDNGIFLITCAGYKVSEPIKNAQYYTNSIILANTQEEYEYYSDNFDLDVLFCNHNAFLNEDRFIIREDIKKEYNLVVSSCFSKYKNVSYAEKIPNVLHIGYVNESKVEYIPNFGYRANFKNNSTDINDWNWICTKKYVSLLNSAICGGIFSAREGSCFASSEYLLCGLPVISTKSVGGRDVFYNEHNSVICDNNSDSVKNVFDELIKNIQFYDKHKIRENKLKQMDYFRDVLTVYVQNKIEDKYKESVDTQELKNLLKFYDNSNEW